jgi:hypothetical protein
MPRRRRGPPDSGFRPSIRPPIFMREYLREILPRLIAMSGVLLVQAVVAAGAVASYLRECRRDRRRGFDVVDRAEQARRYSHRSSSNRARSASIDLG